MRGGIAYDLVYNPPDTKLLQQARLAGAGTIGGLEMLVAQAEEQFDVLDRPAGAGRRDGTRRARIREAMVGVNV